MSAVVAVDQGTTSTKAYRLDVDGRFEPVAEIGHEQFLPQRGRVEHDPLALIGNVVACIERAGPVDAIGIDNQGETVVAWDAGSGRPLGNAIVWQDIRTQDAIDRLKAEGAEAETLARAGLPLDAYFSAAKLRWLLDHAEGARDLARRGRLRLGTSDAFFLDRLTGVYATDVSTASRTSLMNLRTLEWDATLCDLFGVPGELLPEIRPTAGVFGECRVAGRTVPVTANVVDQTAALFGHRCFSAGRAKITFGTGAFALAATGEAPIAEPASGLLPTVAWQATGMPATYAVDGGVYNAGSAVNWARDQGLFAGFAEIDSFAGPSALSRGIVFVPALSGLACPYWDRDASGLFIGLGLDVTRADLARAVLEGVAMRTAQVVARMSEHLALEAVVSVDGGLSRNGYFRQFLADALDRTIVRPATPDATSLGTAWLAMLGAGLARSVEDLPESATGEGVDRPVDPVSAAQHARFADAVDRARGWWRAPASS